jgi:putative oxidoreductase
MIDESSNIDKSRLIIPQLAGLYRSVAPLSYAFIRIVVALVLLPDGIDKIFLGGVERIATGNIAKLGLPLPYVWAWTVGGLEFLGAILLGLGLFTRPVAVALAVMLTVIVVDIAAPRGFLWTSNGIEIALLLELATIGFLFGGGGRYSIDRVIGREF